MGPQHPSTHGVLRLVLELEGETVTEARVVIGYLHTGIEKNTEYRNWTQGVTFVTRMDYLSPFFNETAYCLGVEKLLGITDEVPERATTIRVLMMELNRIASHLVWLATGGMELGALSAMLYGFREREVILDIFEMITGLRMNHAYVRPGGVAQDLPAGAVEKIREFLRVHAEAGRRVRGLLTGQPIWQQRTQGVGYLDVAGCMALGITGPCCARPACRGTCARPSRTAATRPTTSTCRPRRRRLLRALPGPDGRDARVAEDRRAGARPARPGPVMVEDKKIAWPAQLALGGDGMGNSLDHVRTIMGTSMEALIHHFKLVTEGFRVPPGQVYVAGRVARAASSASTWSATAAPGRTGCTSATHRSSTCRPSPAMCEGGLIADVIAAVACIDPVMGGVDR